jgi:hypothetical protein
MRSIAVNRLIAHGPFAAVMSYVCGSMLLYWAGPIVWPMTNALELAIYQVLAVFALSAGYVMTGSKIPKLRPSISLRPFFRAGVLLTLALQIPLTMTYTDKYPWDVFQTIFDQRAAYEEMLDQVMSQQGTRFYVPLFRSVIMPFFYAALTYGVLNFRTLKRLDKVLLILMILCPVNLSLLRGTDKEIFDIVIVIGGLVMISLARRSILTAKTVKIAGRKLLFALLAVCIIGIAIFLLFTYRKYQRLDSTDAFCFAENLICADYNGLIMSILPDFISFGISMFTFYLTNGYYGLSIALQQPWSFAYGIGHSSALMSLFERFSDGSLLDATLIGKMSVAGWDHRFYWASIFTWIASDVGFFGALVFIGLIARWFHQAWIDAVYLKNDCAAVVFILLCVLFFYLPANNQLTQTFDSYLAFLAAIIAWKILGKYRRLS